MSVYERQYHYCCIEIMITTGSELLDGMYCSLQSDGRIWKFVISFSVRDEWMCVPVDDYNVVLFIVEKGMRH